MTLYKLWLLQSEVMDAVVNEFSKVDREQELQPDDIVYVLVKCPASVKESIESVIKIESGT